MIDTGNGETVHLPGDKVLILYDATLKVNTKQAESIYNGRSKFACSWVMCEEYLLTTQAPPKDITIPALRLYYNPRVNKNWLTYSGGVIRGGTRFGVLLAHKGRVYRVPGWTPAFDVNPGARTDYQVRRLEAWEYYKTISHNSLTLTDFVILYDQLHDGRFGRLSWCK